jgi:hypothetical protein
MSVLSTNAIHEAMDTLLDMPSEQRQSVTFRWMNNIQPHSKTDALAYAVLEYYSDCTFEEMRRLAELPRFQSRSEALVAAARYQRQLAHALASADSFEPISLAQG